MKTNILKKNKIQKIYIQMHMGDLLVNFGKPLLMHNLYWIHMLQQVIIHLI
jgi:hypothetical protein